MKNTVLKTLPLSILLSGCFQSGLLNNKPIEGAGTNSSSNSSEEPDPAGLTAALKIERSLNVEAARNPEYVKTTFANKTFNGVNIQGYGSGENGETFCLSNESYAVTNGFDNPNKCRRPLNSVAHANENEALLLELLQSDPYNLENAKGLPLVIQTLQLYMSHTKPPYPNNFSVVGSNALKIQIQTAPIEFDEERKMLYWNSSQIESFNYNKVGCTPSAPNAVSIDILHDPSLDVCSATNFAAKKCVPRNYHFLTGLWVYERGLSQPFEEQTLSPLGSYASGGTAPSALFSTRTKVFASFIFPFKDSDDEPNFLFFPGNNSEKSPSAAPNPLELSFGMYRAPGTLPLDTSDTLAEDSISDTAMTNIAGVFSTPVMGKYTAAGTLVEAANYTVGWQRRALVGICIQGNRHYYSGTQTVDNVTSPRELLPAYPVVHALKYQLRKIKAYLK